MFIGLSCCEGDPGRHVAGVAWIGLGDIAVIELFNNSDVIKAYFDN